jgi:predicted amidophosphoribosyltransferase
LRSLAFGSCYIYSPRGEGYNCELSRRLCTRLKLLDARWLPVYAARVHELLVNDEAWAQLLHQSAVLVPVPGSTLAQGALWGAERLALALRSIGLGRVVWAGIRRVLPVRKSATALNADRPTVRQHYDSFAIANASPRAPRNDRIVLVDDVITRGRTIFAAALRVQEAFPGADIRAFAFVRTMGFLPTISQTLEPCQGVIRWAGGDVRREP